MEAFERVFGDWMEGNVLPLVNSSLDALRASKHRHAASIYNAITRERLLRYFLAMCLDQLEMHHKHDLDGSRLHGARRGLLGVKRFNAIRPRFEVGVHQLDEVYASWATHLARFLALGSVYCLDETMIPHYGAAAEEAGQLRLAPGKPYDYGLWIYVLSQRLQHSGLPVPLGFRWTRAGVDAAPSEAAVTLLGALQPFIAGPNRTPLIVADSLWCARIVIERLQQRDMQFLIAVKYNNGFVPDDLLDLAKSDLPLRMSRTYINGRLVLEMTGRAKGGAIGLVSNGWVVPDAPLPRQHVCAYETAQALLANESIESLVKMFPGVPNGLKLRPEQLIFEATGWDVLRPPDAQGSSNPLTLLVAQKWKKYQLVGFAKQKLGAAAVKRKNKHELLELLFPDEMPEDGAAAPSGAALQPRKRARKAVQDLAGVRERVCIDISSVHPECGRRCAVTRRIRSPSTTCTRSTAAAWTARTRTTTTSSTSPPTKPPLPGHSTRFASMPLWVPVRCTRSTTPPRGPRIRPAEACATGRQQFRNFYFISPRS
jgi:hypothetical protein